MINREQCPSQQLQKTCSLYLYEFNRSGDGICNFELFRAIYVQLQDCVMLNGGLGSSAQDWELVLYCAYVTLRHTENTSLNKSSLASFHLIVGKIITVYLQGDYRQAQDHLKTLLTGQNGWLPLLSFIYISYCNSYITPENSNGSDSERVVANFSALFERMLILSSNQPVLVDWFLHKRAAFGKTIYQTAVDWFCRVNKSGNCCCRFSSAFKVFAFISRLEGSVHSDRLAVFFRYILSKSCALQSYSGNITQLLAASVEHGDKSVKGRTLQLINFFGKPENLNDFVKTFTKTCSGSNWKIREPELLGDVLYSICLLQLICESPNKAGASLGSYPAFQYYEAAQKLQNLMLELCQNVPCLIDLINCRPLSSDCDFKVTFSAAKMKIIYHTLNIVPTKAFSQTVLSSIAAFAAKCASELLEENDIVQQLVAHLLRQLFISYRIYSIFPLVVRELAGCSKISGHVLAAMAEISESLCDYLSQLLTPAKTVVDDVVVPRSDSLTRNELLDVLQLVKEFNLLAPVTESSVLSVILGPVAALCVELDIQLLQSTSADCFIKYTAPTPPAAPRTQPVNMTSHIQQRPSTSFTSTSEARLVSSNFLLQQTKKTAALQLYPFPKSFHFQAPNSSLQMRSESSAKSINTSQKLPKLVSKD